MTSLSSKVVRPDYVGLDIIAVDYVMTTAMRFSSSTGDSLTRWNWPNPIDLLCRDRHRGITTGNLYLKSNVYHGEAVADEQSSTPHQYPILRLLLPLAHSHYPTSVIPNNRLRNV